MPVAYPVPCPRSAKGAWGRLSSVLCATVETNPVGLANRQIPLFVVLFYFMSIREGLLGDKSIETSGADPYQERYLAHQERKKEVLWGIIKRRHSDRVFSDEDIPRSEIEEIVATTDLCPSSCDRQGVQIKIVDKRDDKELLGGILVGGVGWVHRAKYILLLMADPLAYKAGNEATYMPYLDAGVKVQQLALTTTAYDLAGCFVNPNIREQNVEHFQNVFGEGIFCGAFAIGRPEQ